MYRGPQPNRSLVSVSPTEQKQMKFGWSAKVQVGNLEPIARRFVTERTQDISLTLYIGKHEHFIFEKAYTAELTTVGLPNEEENNFHFHQKNSDTDIRESDEPVVKRNQSLSVVSFQEEYFSTYLILFAVLLLDTCQRLDLVVLKFQLNSLV